MSADNGSSRREFLGALSASVAAAGALSAPSEATAQGSASLKIVDFHNHYIDPSWSMTNLARVPAAARPAQEKINANMQSEAALLTSIEQAGIAARVINSPTAFLEDADGNPPPDATRKINDQMAETCARHPAKLYGLATVDAFSGDEAARELTRAIRELKLRGVFVESARKNLLLGDKESRPMLKAAADLGVPVFVHPQTDPELHKRFSRTGRIGLRYARGTINGAALINMLESGAFDEAPKLHMVVTTLAFGGLILAAGFGNGQNIRSDAPALARRHVYIDTMGLHPALVRTAVDLLGADHVLMGTDWPIIEEKSVPERLAKALAHSGLNPAEQQLVAGGNALRLLGIA
ncbi:MAG: amidohydrolase family protein [Xanthobacteraceae bacterium]|nr:amidohydrolase family protein [Xanthobacteraceae bacterium]